MFTEQKVSIKTLKFSVIIMSILLSQLMFIDAAFSHERFIMPSHTVLSGDKAQSISLISSISNDIFHPDKPLGDNGKGVVPNELQALFKALQPIVITPDGILSTNVSWQAFSRFSVADVNIDKKGTYRIGLIQPKVRMTTYTKLDGNPWRVFGEHASIPEGATNIVRRTTASRVETFVSYNQPNKKAITATGHGLELGGPTHPNDLFVDENIEFQLFYEGVALKESVQVKLVQAGTRHRDQRDEILVTTDNEGKFNFQFNKSGFYLLSANIDINGLPDSGIDIHHYGLYMTLEVFSQ